MSIEQVISRAKVLGLPLAALARQAGVSPPTIHRAQKRGGCNTSTLQALQQVLLRREAEMQARLNALHPPPPDGRGEGRA